MPNSEHPFPTALPANDATGADLSATLFVALELSLTRWVMVASAPGDQKISQHSVAACDGPALLTLLDHLGARAEHRLGRAVRIAAIQEAGRDGFWVHRLLEAHGVQSHVVDPSSIAVNRRSRRAKTDRIDAEAMLRTLMAWHRGERQVCAMVRPPSREAEDARRLSREREALVTERTRHANRIKGLLATQGIFDFEPTWKDRRMRLDALRTPEDSVLPPRLKAELLRQLDRLELVMQQVAAVEAERDATLEVAPDTASSTNVVAPDTEGVGACLLQIKGIGPEAASILSNEAFFRDFRNRRELAAYAGLAPSPWQSGGVDNEQGISKSGNGRVRKIMVQIAWLWLRHQPASVLSVWFREKVRDGRGRIKRIAVIALARKLLVALWRLVTQGVVPSGAVLKLAKAT
jgi:transposase